MLGALTQLNKDKTAFQRIFVQDVRKCEDMLRIIRYLRGLYTKVSSLFYINFLVFFVRQGIFVVLSIYLAISLSL